MSGWPSLTGQDPSCAVSSCSPESRRLCRLLTLLCCGALAR